MLGHHAGRWVMLNWLLDDRKPNPWRDLVHVVRVATSFTKW